MREAIDDASTNAEREHIGEENERKISRRVEAIAAAFEQGDLSEAHEQTIWLRYLMTIRNEVYDLVDK